MKVDKIAILGTGSWGTALAWLWGRNGRQVILWGNTPDRVERIEKTRENSDYMPGIMLPHSIRLTGGLRDCADADLIVFVTPSTAVREIALRLREVLRDRPTVLLSCTKGIEAGSGMRMSQVLGEIFPGRKISVLSGPNLAVEVAKNLPTATVVGCHDLARATDLQRFLGSSRFRIYTSQEVTSIELGGSLKNIFAIAAGISDGLRLGNNSKAALVTRSMAELVRLGVAMGGNGHAFYGLSGAGDLVLTCYSEQSRNYTVGKRLGHGEPLTQITKSMKMVAEGISTTCSAFKRARQLDIETPIIDQVYAILYEQKRPTLALEELLHREQKLEEV